MKLKYKISFVFLAVLLIVFISSCSQKHAETSPNNNNNSPASADSPAVELVSKTMSHRSFSIKIPEDWKEIEYGNAFIYLPQNGEAVDPAVEKVAVLVTFLPENNSVILKEIIAAGIEESKKLLPDLTVSSENSGSVMGNIDKGITVKFTATIQGKIIEYTQITAIHNNVLYVISHSCVKDQCSSTNVFNSMTKSFVVAENIK